MLLVGWEPLDTALDKDVSSLVDVGHVKFVGSHLETLGIVVETGGSDKPPDSPTSYLFLSNDLPILGH